jgi:hypothetical protein
MRRRYLKNISLILFSILLFSCAAKKAAERITVIAPETFAGTITLTACDSGSSADNIIVDAAGHGKTSVCSASPDLRLIVVRGKQSTEIYAKIAKTGDGFVTSISGEVR